MSLKELPSDPALALYNVHRPLAEAEASFNHKIEARGKIASKALPKNGVGAEIGVFTGIFSRVLAAITSPRKLYLVDPWHTKFGECFPPWGAYTAFGKLETKYAMEAARLRTAHLGDRVEVIAARSLDWLPTLPDRHLDWVYLDSTHGYDATLAELHAIAPRLRLGGIIMCDDCPPATTARHHGVFRAVRDFTRLGCFEIVHMQSQQAVLRQSSE